MNRNPFVTTALTNDPNHTLFGKELPVQVKEVPGDFLQPHRHDGNLELDPSVTALRRQADLRSRPLGLSQGTTNEVANSTDFLHVPVDPIFLFIGTAGNLGNVQDLNSHSWVYCVVNPNDAIGPPAKLFSFNTYVSHHYNHPLESHRYVVTPLVADRIQFLLQAFSASATPMPWNS